MACETDQPARRVAAIVLPELLCELAVRVMGAPRQSPLGVVVVEQADQLESMAATAVLDAVNSSARRIGVCIGQTLAEARAFSSRLVVVQLQQELIDNALGRVAEVALAFGATVSVTLPPPRPPAGAIPDTVWVDLTGSTQLFGGEAAVARELLLLVREMGHRVRVAVAAGPRLAQALARWSPLAQSPAPNRPIDTPEQLGKLPVVSLPLDTERAAWLVRLGILSLADLQALPRAAAAARLGEHAGLIFELCAGRDPTPLMAYQPERVLVEQLRFDEPVVGSQPLLFVLKGLLFRISARLAGRGEAAQLLQVLLEHDHSVAELRQVAASTQLQFELASPLWQQEQLHRVVAARLERTRLEAPTVGVGVEVARITPAVTRQLELSQLAGGLVGSDEQTLSVLVFELAADIGQQNLGVLQCVDSHRPEARSRLRAVMSRRTRNRRSPEHLPRCLQLGREPTQLFCPPLPIRSELRAGATFAIQRRLYTIVRLTFVRRLEATEWWSARRVSRDYLQLWLEGSEGGLEALVFVDLQSGARYLQGIAD